MSNSYLSIHKLKHQYVTCLIDIICNEEDYSIGDILKLSMNIKPNQISTHLMKLLLMAMAEEEYLQVKTLKAEIARNLDVVE